MIPLIFRFCPCLTKLFEIEFRQNARNSPRSQYNGNDRQRERASREASQRNTKNGDKFKAMPDCTSFYALQFEMETEMVALRPCDLLEVLMMGYTENDYVFVEVFNTSSQKNLLGIYQNYVHSSGKTILCMDNDAKRDQLGSER